MCAVLSKPLMSPNSASQGWMQTNWSYRSSCLSIPTAAAVASLQTNVSAGEVNTSAAQTNILERYHGSEGGTSGPFSPETCTTFICSTHRVRSRAGLQPQTNSEPVLSDWHQLHKEPLTSGVGEDGTNPPGCWCMWPHFVLKFWYLLLLSWCTWRMINKTLTGTTVIILPLLVLYLRITLFPGRLPFPHFFICHSLCIYPHFSMKRERTQQTHLQVFLPF